MVDQLLNTLLSSKLVFWEENKRFPEPEIQRLWDQHMAYLTTELGANVTHIRPSSIPQKRAVPVTNSLGGPRPSKRRDVTAEAPSPQHLQRQISAPASTAMRRRRSSKTNTSSGPGASRPKQPPTRPINIPASKSFEPRPPLGPPCPVYMSHSLPAHHQARPAYRPSPGVFQDLSPLEYLSQSPDDEQMPGLSLTPFPTVARGESRPQDISRLSVSSAAGYAWDPYSSSRSVSDSGMTSASTATSEPMSRTTTNEMLVEPLQQMCRVGSRLSALDLPEHSTFTNDCSSFDVSSLISETSTVMNDCGSFDVDSLFPQSFNSNVLNSLSDVSFPSFSSSHSFQDTFPGSVDMLPSPSQESNVSSSSDSSQSRHVRRVQEQNAQSKRPLAPKTPSRDSVNPMQAAKIVEVVAEDGTRHKKAQITRFSRQPKETTKVFCPICHDHKEGFRGEHEGFHGEHELRRHVDRTHKGFRKVFVCRDISPDGTFLANCKHCRNNKTYGANYNAAAHLRRVHFNPCVTPKGGRGKVSQNRGGIGGGDQPPMDVLRNWMYETWEENHHVERSTISNNAYPPLGQSATSDASVPRHDDDIQISNADLDFVQQTTQLDMSFLRDLSNDTLNMPMPSSPITNSFFVPSQHDLSFFDTDFSN